MNSENNIFSPENANSPFAQGGIINPTTTAGVVTAHPQLSNSNNITNNSSNIQYPISPMDTQQYLQHTHQQTNNILQQHQHQIRQQMQQNHQQQSVQFSGFTNQWQTIVSPPPQTQQQQITQPQSVNNNSNNVLPQLYYNPPQPTPTISSTNQTTSIQNNNIPIQSQTPTQTPTQQNNISNTNKKNLKEKRQIQDDDDDEESDGEGEDSYSSETGGSGVSTNNNSSLVTIPNNNQIIQQIGGNNNNQIQVGGVQGQGDNLSLLQGDSQSKYVDITHFLNMPQSQAAKRLGIPTSTLSKRWKEAVRSRKWPYRSISKLDKEIMTLLHNIPQTSDGEAASLPADIEASLGVLLRRRQEELRPVVIRL